MHDVVLIQLGPNILESSITKSSQADLCKRFIDDHITSKLRDEPCLLGNRQTWESTVQPQQH